MISVYFDIVLEHSFVSVYAWYVYMLYFVSIYLLHKFVHSQAAILASREKSELEAAEKENVFRCLTKDIGIEVCFCRLLPQNELDHFWPVSQSSRSEENYFPS